VRALQEFLAKDNTLYPEGIVSGYFGPATERAVKKFQEKHGLARPGDQGYGYVGPKTRQKLNSL
jgi:peptidoglycan hydrolase-like protein with peptidoglycan-binding domain